MLSERPTPTEPTPPQGSLENRRLNDPMSPLIELVRQIHDSQLELQANQKSLNDQLTQHMITEKAELAIAIALLMKDSFPQGDPTGHRRDHEARIKIAEARAILWQEVKSHLIKSGLVAALFWLAFLVWKGALLGPER